MALHSKWDATGLFVHKSVYLSTKATPVSLNLHTNECWKWFLWKCIVDFWSKVTKEVETSETEKWTETIFYGKSFWLLVQQPNTFLSTFWFLYPTNCGPITWCLTTNCGRHSSVDPSEPTILRPRVRIASKTSTLFQYFIVEMKNPDFHRTCHFSNGICKLERSWKMVEIVVSRNCIRLKRGRAWRYFKEEIALVATLLLFTTYYA